MTDDETFAPASDDDPEATLPDPGDNDIAVADPAAGEDSAGGPGEGADGESEATGTSDSGDDGAADS